MLGRFVLSAVCFACIEYVSAGNTKHALSKEAVKFSRKTTRESFSCFRCIDTMGTTYSVEICVVIHCYRFNGVRPEPSDQYHTVTVELPID